MSHYVIASNYLLEEAVDYLKRYVQVGAVEDKATNIYECNITIQN